MTPRQTGAAGAAAAAAPAARTVYDLLRASAGRQPRAVALTALGASLSYRALLRDVDALAAWLCAQGLAPGARVAVALPNVMAHPVACLAIMRAGLTAVCVNPLYTSEELSAIFRDSEVRAVVLFDMLAPAVRAALEENRIRIAVLVSPGDQLGWRGPMVNWLAGRAQPDGGRARVTITGAVSWRAALASGARWPAAAPQTAEQQGAMMLYSGGTTGRPKGVPLSQQALLFGVAQQYEALAGHVSPAGERAYTLLLAVPLYHILGLGNLMFSLARGGKTVLVMRPRDTAAFVREWRRHRVTSFPGVNTMFNSLIADQAFARLNFSSLELCLGAGMAVSESTALRWHQLTGCHITEAYGLTETGLVCRNPPGPSRPGSVGLPVPGVEIVLRDEQGAEVASGPGEICLRGKAVMDAYWNNPEENSTAFTPDGFFRTGDIGVFDADGFLRLVDRKKEMIICSGFKVFPSEIERVLNGHPGVLECAVVAARDERAGEVPIAYVVRRDPALDAATLSAFCAPQLAAYKRPRRIVFLADLPKSNVGKILRRSLVEAAAVAEGQPDVR